MSTVNPIFPQEASRFRIDATAAEIDAAMAYEKIFVPALFRFWPRHLIKSARIEPGDRTLDVACGTGALTRDLAKTVGKSPAPVGLDVSPGMLVVAQRLNPEIQWRQGDAQALPFEDGSFDRVLCQFGLMFFADKVAAISEMRRVLAPGGMLVMAVWDSLDNNPGFLEKVDILDRLAGCRAGDALRAPFCLGDREPLGEYIEQAGLQLVEVKTLSGETRFSNLYEFVEAEVRGWLPVMDVHLSEDVISAIHAECRRILNRYENGPHKGLRLPMSAHLVIARRQD